MAALYISDYLRESLAGGNLREIRGALLGYVEMDPAFKTSMFLDAVKYAEEQGFSVYAKHDPSITVESGLSDKDRFYQIQTGLYHNFSQERVRELMQVGKKCMQDAPVYRVTDSSLNSQSGKSASSEKKPEDSPRKKAEGQDRRMAARRWMVPAILAVILTLGILFLIFRRT